MDNYDLALGDTTDFTLLIAPNRPNLQRIIIKAHEMHLTSDRSASYGNIATVFEGNFPNLTRLYIGIQEDKDGFSTHPYVPTSINGSGELPANWPKLNHLTIASAQPHQAKNLFNHDYFVSTILLRPLMGIKNFDSFLKRPCFSNLETLDLGSMMLNTTTRQLNCFDRLSKLKTFVLEEVGVHIQDSGGGYSVADLLATTTHMTPLETLCLYHIPRLDDKGFEKIFKNCLHW